MKTLLNMLVWLVAATNVFAAISVSNLTASQRPGSKKVDINFDVYDSFETTVGVDAEVFVDGVELSGSNSFFGNIGVAVPVGNSRHIVWDGETDLNHVLSSNLSFNLKVFPSAGSGMVYIPGGTNQVSDPDFSYTLISAPLFMDATEITKAEWDSVDASAYGIYPSSGSAYGSSHPVQTVTWIEAVKWCNARSIQDGLTPCYDAGLNCNFSSDGYRLPTIEEWEYAARGGESGWLYPWGNSIANSNANCRINGFVHPDFGGVTCPATYFSPNGYGLYNMAGNVWEWCEDSIGVDRLLKGGSFMDKQNVLRNGHYGFAPPSSEGDFIGFRTVRNAPEPVVQSITIVFDSRDYELTVNSDFGSPFPMVGTSTFAWNAAVTCAVESAVMVGGTNYTCVGWSGTGSVPVNGSGNEVIVILNNLISGITWNWASEDTDFDGMNDDWEIAHFGNLGQSATDDHDFDGQNNGDEYIAGTNPTNPASLFQLSEAFADGQLVLEWPTASNRTYNLYWTDNLRHTAFSNIAPNIAFPRNSATVTPVKARSFYKMDVKK